MYVCVYLIIFREKCVSDVEKYLKKTDENPISLRWFIKIASYSSLKK